MAYKECCIAAIPVAYREQYGEYYEKITPVFKEHGALDITFIWQGESNDVDLSLAASVQCEEDEIALCRMITWPSKDARQAGMEKCRHDSRMTPLSPVIPMALKKEMLADITQTDQCKIIPIPTKLMQAG